MSADAPPLGNRPTEPLPGKQSLVDPQGKALAAAESNDGGDGGKDDGGVCPDCGLPYRDHPDFSAGHGGGHGHHHPAPFDSRDAPGSPSADERRLPGEELDPTGLGGDPAGT